MSLLFSPFSFSGLKLRNRLVMPPMATAIEGPGGSQVDNGLPGEATLEYYRERAAGGVGMVIVEHTYIDKRGKAHKGQFGLDNDEAVPAFARLADTIRSQGAVAAIQLNHCGAVANPEVTGGEPLGPSDTPNPRSERKPRGMTVDEIHAAQDAWAAAAHRVMMAGFDAVEIHSAHGYLGTQFLSPLTNTRTDQYGGSLENRARFILETVAKVRESVGPVFPVFVRLGTTDGALFGQPLPEGFEVEDAVKVSWMLEEAGVALIDVSGGFAGSRPTGMRPGYFAPNSAAIKKAVAIPVLVTGGITDGPLAESVLKDGHADLIGVGRSLLRNSKWASEARKALVE